MPPEPTYLVIMTQPLPNTTGEIALGKRLVVDVTLSESYSLDSEITDYPVESGGSISDNIRPRPRSLDIECIVSNTPLDRFRLVRQYNENGECLAARMAQEFLESIYTTREPVTIVASKGVYTDMGMQNLTMQVNKDTGDALHFTAKFQQIERVSNARVEIKRTSTRNTKNKVSLGAQPLSFANEQVVRWRKGINGDIASARLGGSAQFLGGSPIIGEEEFVFFVPANNPGNTNQNVLALTPFYIGQRAAGINDGLWLHNDKATPLTVEEVKRLRLDLERDRKARNPYTRISPNPVPSGYDKLPDKTRKPIGLNELNKKPAADIHKFTNRGRNAS